MIEAMCNVKQWMQRVISVLLRNLVYGLDVYSLHCFSFIYLFELTVALDCLVGQIMVNWWLRWSRRNVKHHCTISICQLLLLSTKPSVLETDTGHCAAPSVTRWMIYLQCLDHTCTLGVFPFRRMVYVMTSINASCFQLMLTPQCSVLSKQMVYWK